MNVRRLLTVAVAALLVSAGAGAAAASTGGTTTSTATADVDSYEADAGYDNGTVTFVVTANGSGVEGLDVAVDNDSVGTTDANGSVTFETDESAFEVTATGENVTGEFAYELENDSLTLVEGGFEYADEGDDEAENETRGPPSEMPDQAAERALNVHAVINAYLAGDLDENTTLGEALRDVASGDKSPEEAGAPADAGRPDHAGPPDDDDDEDRDRGKPDDVGPPHDDGDDDDGEDDDDDGEDDDDDGEDDDDDDEDDEDDDGDDRGNGNGNGPP
ncbi:hypothetical protein [Halorarum salinum]|uniref:Uncharacterized protein n=1 Tax=Halorarum salinum TaxID=2743089 RepID=A0A7D5L9V7_9EURY|nr:hypothetical protein [Halobaculum salinum]QLG61534.1 hypothetical protein HUG12_07250 [Halobaculum salinum]